MTATTTTKPEEKVTTGSSTNVETGAPGPKLKPETEEQAKMWREGKKLDTNTNVIDTPIETVDKMLKHAGLPTRQELQEVHAGLHQLTASSVLADGQIAQAHWETQKESERGPVIAPVSYWDGQSITSTHVPNSVERIPGKNETVTVPHQVNITNHQTFGRNTGQMAAVRKSLRNNAAK